jgi:hypothetical protein
LPQMLSGTARQWINDLAANSIQTGSTCKLHSPKTSRGLTRDPITLVTSNGPMTRPSKLSLHDG